MIFLVFDLKVFLSKHKKVKYNETFFQTLITKILCTEYDFLVHVLTYASYLMRKLMKELELSCIQVTIIIKQLKQKE